ncbi:conserved hypothetical protein [Theileria orientalis strain Shintoku]|uniref:Uncharacterized protein n=1 Tax=Theileria orientalis strain Shintoku TaxID=869250 RepID=J7M880_THEOR|nr:conserved hypothetical protein [Theileria orientalis strain Shintoku]PVC54255.1 hypothetical protein MACL_00003227 [Theileria orientalis]BAM38668.1 conserved hypothetical protein [Theileria orientalis strain Shintoku]|eukprot:XP_009688969.1 conserved hypothetical protein [Theileria orientalis strain Shintoku]
MDDLENMLLKKGSNNTDNDQVYVPSDIEDYFENRNVDPIEFEDYYEEQEDVDLNLSLVSKEELEQCNEYDINNMNIEPAGFDSELNLNATLIEEIKDENDDVKDKESESESLCKELNGTEDNEEDADQFNAENAKNENNCNDKKLNAKLDKLYRKLQNEYEQYESLFKKLDSLSIREVDKSLSLNGSETKACGKKGVSSETGKIKSIYKASNKKLGSKRSSGENGQDVHYIYRRLQSIYVDYSKIAKAYKPISRSLSKCKSSFCKLDAKLVKLKLNLTRSLKFYKMMMTKYNLEELKSTIDNLTYADNKIYDAISNTRTSSKHIKGANCTLEVTKRTKLLQNEFLRNRLTSTVIQMMKISVESHEHTKSLVKSVIETVKTELDKVTKMDFEGKRNTIFNHRTNTMKSIIKCVSRITISASIQVLRSQSSLTNLEKSIAEAVPDPDKAKLTILSLRENDLAEPFDLRTLKFRQLFGLYCPSTCKISSNFGMANKDLMTHLTEFKKQLLSELKAVGKTKSRVYRSQFYVVSDHKVFNTSMNVHSEGIHTAYYSVHNALTHIRISLVLVNKCINFLNLIIKQNLQLTGVEQLGYCIEAFVKEAAGNQLFAKQEINLSYKDLEKSYVKMNACRNGQQNVKMIDVQEQMDKMKDTMEESNKATIKAFIAAEWVGIKHIHFQNERVPIDYPTLCNILNDKYKFKL